MKVQFTEIPVLIYSTLKNSNWLTAKLQYRFISFFEYSFCIKRALQGTNVLRPHWKLTLKYGSCMVINISTFSHVSANTIEDITFIVNSLILDMLLLNVKTASIIQQNRYYI